jgi:V8-like Glu-specific endopeptidase
MIKLSFLIMGFAFHLAQAASPEIGKIIGADDLIPVKADASNIPSQFQNSVDAIGWTNYGCTVTHIGKGYALTAGHCFEATEVLTQNKGCRFAHVDWGYRVGQDSNLTSQCDMIIAMQKTEFVDFAILKFSTYPKAFFEIEFDRASEIGDKLTIFSHPDGRPLQWSQYCNLETPGGGEIPLEKMSYRCDTEGGSSGAVIISADSGKVVGIHNGGYPTMNYGTYILNEPLLGLLKSLLQ